MSVLLDLDDARIGRVGRLVLADENIGKADDAGQDIVEIMGDAGGELADGLKLGALRDLPFERLLLGHVEGIDDRRLVVAVLHRRQEQPHGAFGIVAGLDVDGREIGLAGEALGDRQRQRGPARLGDEIGHRLLTAARVAAGHDAREGRIGAADPTLPVERRDAKRSVVEKPREAHLGGAQGFGLARFGTAIEHHGARGQRRAVLGEGDLVQQPDRQRPPVAANEVEIVGFGSSSFTVASLRRGQEMTGAASDEILDRERAVEAVGEIAAEPLRQRRVHRPDMAVAVERHEADGRIVEIVDRGLQFEEGPLLAPPFGRHVGDPPQGPPLGLVGGFERPDIELQEHPLAGHALDDDLLGV